MFSGGRNQFFVKVLFIVENVFKFMNVALFVRILKHDRIDFQRVTLFVVIFQQKELLKKWGFSLF